MMIERDVHVYEHVNQIVSTSNKHKISHRKYLVVLELLIQLLKPFKFVTQKLGAEKLQQLILF